MERNPYLGQMDSDELIALAKDVANGEFTKRVAIAINEVGKIKEELLLELSLRLNASLQRREREIAYDKALGHTQY